MTKIAVCLTCSALTIALVAAGAPIPAKSGAALCGALTPADFQAAGVAGAAKPAANVQDGGASVYCVYAGKSSATGGIELDVFHPAGGNVAEAQETFRLSIAEGSSGLQPISISGADEARWSAATKSGGPAFATIAVRRGTLVFVLGFPTGPNAQTHLTKLAGVVLGRL